MYSANFDTVNEDRKWNMKAKSLSANMIHLEIENWQGQDRVVIDSDL